MDESRHPINANLSWKPKPPVYTPICSYQQQPPPSSPIEEAIVNLSKVVGHFVEEQKTVNA